MRCPQGKHIGYRACDFIGEIGEFVEQARQNRRGPPEDENTVRLFPANRITASRAPQVETSPPPNSAAAPRTARVQVALRVTRSKLRSGMGSTPCLA